MQFKLLLSTLLGIAVVSVQAQNSEPFWSLAGNSNATPSSKLGTLNYTPLLLKTNNLSRIYISPDGKIGIGTNSPTTQLHVEGQTLLNIFVNTVAPGLQSGSGLIGYVKGAPTAAGQRLGYFLMGSQGGGTDPYNATGLVGYADGAWSSGSRPAYLAFETTKTGTMQRSEGMRISSGGKVGIGVQTPAYRLHVVDSSTAIYAQSLGDYGYGISAVGGTAGILSSGRDYAVYGTGTNTGVYGTGYSYGVWGVSNTVGVYGQGYVGLRGVTDQDFGDAIQGTSTGASSYGGNFSSSFSLGLYSTTAATNSYAGYFAGKVYTSGVYVTSDKKLKKNITDFTDAVSLIKKLKPKQYEFQTDGKLAEMNLPKGKHYGLIAQDLETVFPELVMETIQYPHHDTSLAKRNSGSAESRLTFKAVNYTELIPIMIKGMQEQDAEKEALRKTVEEQGEKLQALEAAVERLTAQLSGTNSSSMTSASLEVPVPNPAKGNTNIRYSIPGGAASARLTVVNMLGQVMKEVRLAGGAGQLNLDVSALPSGTYPCTLWVNGQQAVSKQLVIAH